MGLPRTFVGFSSTDIRSFRLMLAWKDHEHIDFNFTNVQLASALDSTNEEYIKRRCREQITMAGTYILLIGEDTWQKTTFVKWEVEVAIEQKCRLIALNIDNCTRLNPLTCPAFIARAGAVFASLSPHIVQWALQEWQRPDPQLHEWYYFEDWVYQRLGYVVNGSTAKRPPKPNPFA